MIHVRRGIGDLPSDPRMRAFWRYHADGAHKAPREGNRPDHFYACSWCCPSRSAFATDPSGYADIEWEQFLMPDLGSGLNPIALVAGRVG